MLAASEIRRLRREIVRLNRRVALAHIEGEVVERDAEKWKVRLDIGKDADGKPVLSPWVKPHSNSAGAYKESPALPAIGDRMRLVSPSGNVGAASYAVPSAYDNEQKRPGDQDKDEAAREFGKTRLSQTKDTVEQKTEKTSVKQTKENINVKADKKFEAEAEEARIKGKTTRLHADSIDKLKIIIGDQAYRIREEALLPTGA